MVSLAMYTTYGLAAPPAFLLPFAPQPPVTLASGREVAVSQCNNMYIFPGERVCPLYCHICPAVPGEDC